MSPLSRPTIRAVVAAVTGAALAVGAGARLAAAEWPQTGESDTRRPLLHVSDINAGGIFRGLEEGTRATSSRAADRLDPGRPLVSGPVSRTARDVLANGGAPRWWARLRTDPRRWPQLWPNTTSCTLSLDPITRRHWWER